MIGIPVTGTLKRSIIKANVSSGYQFTTIDGRPAQVALIDDLGNVIEQGETLAREIWNVCIGVQKNFRIAQGHIVVHRSPPGLSSLNIRLAPLSKQRTRVKEAAQ